MFVPNNLPDNVQSWRREVESRIVSSEDAVSILETNTRSALYSIDALSQELQKTVSVSTASVNTDTFEMPGSSGAVVLSSPVSAPDWATSTQILVTARAQLNTSATSPTARMWIVAGEEESPMVDVWGPSATTLSRPIYGNVSLAASVQNEDVIELWLASPNPGSWASGGSRLLTMDIITISTRN